jgi:ubiquinone/menaquinone biosynthesis C-methylase UbiE
LTEPSEAFFDARAAQYDEEKAEAHSRIARAVIRSIGQVGRPELVLDVGVGSGAVAAAVQAAFRCGLVGVDVSQEMLDVAGRRRWPGPRPALVRARAEDMPFEDARFDWVMSTSALQYLRPAAIAEIARVAADDALLLLGDAEPARDDAEDFLRRLARVGAPIAMGVQDSETVTALLVDSGFSVVASERIAYRRRWRDLEAKALAAGGPPQAQEVRALRRGASAATRAAYAMDADALTIPYGIHLARRDRRA